MSQNNDSFDIFDPTGMIKGMRDSNMDAWAKIMVQMINSDAYAQASGEMLDAWLSSSGPFRRVTETAMNEALANLNLPSRDDITRLAKRVTNIEMLLDSLDAKLDAALKAAPKAATGRKPKASSGKTEK